MLNAVALDDDTSFWQLLKERRLSAIAERIGAHPFLWVAAAVCPVVAGALASFFPDSIKNASWPFFLSSGIELVPSIFWLAIAGTGLSFGLGQWSQSRAGSALRVMIRRLQTLPPSGFLDAFRDSYRASADQAILTVLLGPSATLQQVEHAIRNLLGAIVECARDFDERGRATYGASIMLWKPLGTPFESTSPRHLAGFLPCDPSIRGYLELVPALSTTTALQEKSYAQDPSMAAITLPIPVETEKILDKQNHSRDPVLPGAAQAFVHGDVVVFESRDAYIKWLDDHSSRDLNVIKGLKDYFLTQEGKHVRSFGAQPILAPASQDSSDAIAVLNIHSDEENLLQDSGQTLFAPLIEPFCFMLAILIKQREILIPSQPKAGGPHVASNSNAESAV